VLVGAGLAVGAGVAAWAGPALLWIDPLRRHLTPGLAGLGRPGHVALTFDDGPDPESTPAFLEALERLGWKATFFMLGRMAELAPGLAGEVAAAGHEIAVHGYDHRGALWRRPATQTADLRRATDVLATTTGATPLWHRPAYGELSTGALIAARRVGLRTVMWTAWGRDWRPQATPASVVVDVLAGTIDGGTVLLHDSDCTSADGSWKNTLASLDPLAEAFAAAGLTVGPLRDHEVGR